MFTRARVKKELQVDSSPETSTKVATHSAASEAPSVGSHETVASAPLAEKPVAEKSVSAEPHPGKSFVERILGTKDNYNTFTIFPFQM